MRKVEAVKAYAWTGPEGHLANWAEPTFMRVLEIMHSELASRTRRVRIIRETDFKYLLSLAQQAEKALASAKSFAAELPRKKGRK